MHVFSLQTNTDTLLPALHGWGELNGGDDHLLEGDLNAAEADSACQQCILVVQSYYCETGINKIRVCESINAVSLLAISINQTH